MTLAKRLSSITVLAIIGLAPGCKERLFSDSDPLATKPGERKLVGEAAEYKADPRPPKEIAKELHEDFDKRRAFGWSVFAKVIRPVPLSESAREKLKVSSPLVPAWITWYTADEVAEIYRLYYLELLRLKKSGACTADAATCEPSRVARWAITAYSEQRNIGESNDFFETLVQTINDQPANAGAIAAGAGKGESSIRMTLYNKELVMHYLERYEHALACAARHLPPSGRPPAVKVEPLSVDVIGECFGPNGEFPPAAVSVKSAWQRVVRGAKIRAHDTSPVGLGATLDKAEQDWASAVGADVELPKGPNDVFRVRVASSGPLREYVLTGLHITTKETPEWVWVSLWWSPKASEDFGSDRPGKLCIADDSAACDRAATMMSQFANYKMCVTTDFKEGDRRFFAAAAEAAAFGSRASVAASLIEAYKRTGGHTWCSNGFHEFGPKEAASNCIGCHQFAAPGVNFVREPEGGSIHNVFDKQVNRFPADFLWTFSSRPERLVLRVRDVKSEIDDLQQGDSTQPGKDP